MGEYSGEMSLHTISFQPSNPQQSLSGIVQKIMPLSFDASNDWVEAGSQITGLKECPHLLGRHKLQEMCASLCRFQEQMFHKLAFLKLDFCYGFVMHSVQT